MAPRPSTSARRTKVQAQNAPRIQPPQLETLTPHEQLPGDQFADRADYYQLALTHGDLSNQAAEGVMLEQVHFKRVTLSGTRLIKAQITDVRFEHCDLSQLDLERSRLNRVEFVNCRMLGAKWLEVKAEDVTVRDCTVEYGLFISATLKRCEWASSILRSASFEDAALARVTFRKCDLTGAVWTNAQLEHTDLRGSEIAGMTIGLEQLKGAVLDPLQVMHVAGFLGIKVQTIEEKS